MLDCNIRMAELSVVDTHPLFLLISSICRLLFDFVNCFLALSPYTSRPVTALLAAVLATSI